MPGPIAGLSLIEPLKEIHECGDFDCGKSELNDWLQRYALQSQRANGARTFIVHDRNAVKGYYSLSAASVRKEESPERLGSGLGKYPIPVVLLARLARDRVYAGAGLGKALLKDAMLRVIQIAENLAVRALIVDAIDEEAVAFYNKAGFVRFPENRMRLMIMLKDMQRNIVQTSR